MHYVGVISIVHFKAKRLGLKGMPASEIPKLWDVIRRGWPTAIPLAVLIYVLFSGYSPHMAAFWGITTALVVGFLNPMHRIGINDIMEGCVTGVKYALAVGAVCSAIGIVVGVVNTTGLGFRLGFMVTEVAVNFGEATLPLIAWFPLADFDFARSHLIHIVDYDCGYLYFYGCWIANHSALYNVGDSSTAGAW